MRAYIYQRKTLDWSHLTWDQFVSSQKKENVSWVVHKVGIWNGSFDIDYFSFRAELKSISQDNWRSTSNYAVVDNIYSLSEGDFVIPSDDDDWFPPDVIDKVSTTDANLVFWNQGHLLSNNFTFINSRRTDVAVYGTNSYAVAKKLLDDYGFLDRHWDAGWHLFEKMHTVKIPDMVSVWVNTPASWSEMDSWTDSESLFKAMKTFADGWSNFQWMPWMSPYLERVTDLAYRTWESRKKRKFFL